MNQHFCPCHSKKSYKQCCARWHRGTNAPSAVDLMRSRYSAYALLRADYIVATTLPGSSAEMTDRKAWLLQIRDFGRKHEFFDLVIFESIESKTQAWVCFQAGLRLGEKDVSFTEKSFFQKERGRWLYSCGEPKPIR